MQTYDDTLLEPFEADSLLVPLLRVTPETLPDADIVVGDQTYHYDRSYPLKGYGAVLPEYLQAQVNAGKKPLLLERPDRLYVYLAA